MDLLLFFAKIKKKAKMYIFRILTRETLMKESSSKSFDHFLHPYVFVLKEGQEIQQNFLDYSLLLLHVGQADILPSPHHPKNFLPAIQMFKRFG